jgi:hypothetical protein
MNKPVYIYIHIYIYIITHLSGQSNCALLAPQAQKSVTLRPQPGGGPRSLYGHVVALGKNNKQKTSFVLPFLMVLFSKDLLHIT